MSRRKFVSGLKMMKPKHLIENGVNSNKLTYLALSMFVS